MSELSQLSRSHSFVHQHSVTWIIPNFSKVVDKTNVEGICDPSLQSGVIKFPSSKCEWKLSFYAKHASEVDYIAFSLSREKIDPDVHEVRTKISLIDLHGKIMESSEKTNWYRILTRVVTINKVNNLPNDTLTVRCNFQIIFKYTKSDSDGESIRNLKTLTSQITSELATLYDSQRCTDVTLRCGDGSEFPVHKAILAARSPVFSNMFQNDMLENQTNLVKISDIQAPVVRELLYHIYGKCSENLPPDIYLELYEAADKYQLLELKLDCRLKLVKNLNSDNVCGVAVVADLHDDPDLFSAAKMFMQKNALKSHLVTSDTWIDFVKKSPDMANRLITID